MKHPGYFFSLCIPLPYPFLSLPNNIIRYFGRALCFLGNNVSVIQKKSLSLRRIMKQLLFIFALFISIISSNPVSAQGQQTKTQYTDFENDTLQLQQVEVSVGRKNRLKLQHVTSNTELIGQDQLVRAACCNLGESFVTNPSVDVDYSDAATGAQQIKLLGLSGTYVQMLTENIPNLRGAALPFALSFVPGPWMQSIQVSKGASSVRNGYESTTGQINIEFLKPQGVEAVEFNAYLDQDMMYEFNLAANHHFTDRFSVGLLAHFDEFQGDHDENGDTFVDMPKQRQWNVMPRLAYVSPHWISQLSLRALRDERQSGQLGHAASHLAHAPYTIGINTDRYEFQWKNGFPFNDGHSTSIALMLHGSWHDAQNRFGLTQYNFLQKNGYAQLMFETDLTERHNLSVGLSMNHDYYKNYFYKDWAPDRVGNNPPYVIDIPGFDPSKEWSNRMSEQETTTGAYAQYTYKVDDQLSVMAGLRADYSDLYERWFVTPRLHAKYSPTEWFTLRASAGKGYRTPHPVAENVTMLISGRELFTDFSLLEPVQEEAWNYGLSASLTLPIAGRDLDLNAEYYYTDFLHQLVIEYADVTHPNKLFMHSLQGSSYSHTLQVDASYPFFEGFTALAAYRYNDARTTYANGQLRRRPLTSRYKGLLSLSYKTPLELWRFDVTGQLNGPGVLYDQTSYPHYYQLQAQVTREFRHFSLYVGGENLTDYTIPEPIVGADNPWSRLFDATQVWGPMDGMMIYMGIRIKFEKF